MSVQYSKAIQGDLSGDCQSMWKQIADNSHTWIETAFVRTTLVLVIDVGASVLVEVPRSVIVTCIARETGVAQQTASGRSGAIAGGGKLNVSRVKRWFASYGALTKARLAKALDTVDRLQSNTAAGHVLQLPRTPVHRPLQALSTC